MQMHSWVRYGNIEAVRGRLEHIPLNKQKDGGVALLGIAARSRLAGVDMLRLLVEQGAKPNGVDSQIDGTALSIAAKSGDIDKVRFLLQAGADPHFRNSSGYTPLINAVYGQGATRPEVVRLLLDVGADPNVITSYNESPLRTAFYFSDFETLKILLDAGADSEILDWNALMHTIAFGTWTRCKQNFSAALTPERKTATRHDSLVAMPAGRRCGGKAEKLVKNGAKINSDDLFMAVGKDNPAMVRWLIDNGADVNAGDSYQHSVLSQAATWGANACVKLLIEAGADIHAEDHVQSQPISHASTPEIARMLVEAGADINFISGEGYTLLKYSAEGIGNVEMVRALLDMGADTDTETKRYSTTPLYVAVQKDDLEIARMLLEAGANPNAQNVDLWFPLSNAQSIEMVQLLLDHGANIHLTDGVGKDALQHQDDPEVAAYLIEAGAQVNPNRGQSGSPLREAANNGNLEMMRLLLQRGANVDQAMSWGETALMRAAEHSFVEGVRLLLEHHANVHLTSDERGATALFYAAAPEGFTAYDLMKKYGGNSWLDNIPEEQRALFEKTGIDQPENHSTYGYVASDSVEVLEMLLGAGADINARDAKEMTPLILAASCGRPARVTALLRAGADIHLRDAEGKTALDHARLHPEAEHREAIVQMLENAEGK